MAFSPVSMLMYAARCTKNKEKNGISYCTGEREGRAGEAREAASIMHSAEIRSRWQSCWKSRLVLREGQRPATQRRSSRAGYANDSSVDTAATCRKRQLRRLIKP